MLQLITYKYLLDSTISIMEIKNTAEIGQTLFYYQLYHPEIQLHIELPSQDLGVYKNHVFASLLESNIAKEEIQYSYQLAPKIKAVVFLDALYQASKGMEPFLTISTRLFKLIVDEHQDKAVDQDLDVELYTKIKTIYWNILQEDAAESLINQGFEIVVQDAIKIYTEKLLTESLRH